MARLHSLGGARLDEDALFFRRAFAVHDGKRTPEEQRILVQSGASQTMKSRHLTGHAVDLVPVINGKLRWEWPPIYQIARAMKQAALELSVPIRWGGCWSRLNTL